MSQQQSQGQASGGPCQSTSGFAFSSQQEGLSGTGTLGGMNASAQSIATTINADPNSPELFAQNLAHAQREVLRLQTLARQALDGVQNAYHVGYSPEGTAEIMVELKVALNTLVDTLRKSGVGSLPLIAQAPPPPNAQTPTATMSTPTATAGTAPISTITIAKPVVPSEPELLQIATKQVQVLYDQLKAKQENAGVVANLLGVVGGDLGQARR